MTASRGDADRLHKLVLLLSSNQPGEVAAAAAAIGRLLTSRGRSWHDLAQQLCEPSLSPPPPPPPSSPGIIEMLDGIANHGDGWLTQWETEFCDSVREQYRRRGQLSPKQQNILERIWKKVAW
jgi:hypothetical protein